MLGIKSGHPKQQRIARLILHFSSCLHIDIVKRPIDSRRRDLKGMYGVFMSSACLVDQKPFILSGVHESH